MRTGGRIILMFTFMSLTTAARMAKECSPPGQFPNTRLSEKYLGRKKFSSGEKVYYNCAEDFTPVTGSRSVQCTDGKWSEFTLKCEKKSCGYSGDLPNGQFNFDRDFFIGDRVYAVCNKGYTLTGSGFLTCSQSGWTGEFPKCIEGATTCLPPAVTDSVQKGVNVSAYRPGDQVTFACSRGFDLDGARLIACGSDGQWEPRPPRCVPSPARPPAAADPTRRTADPSRPTDGGCGAPKVGGGSNARLMDEYAAQTRFNSKDKVYYTCDVGYMAAGGTRTRKCDNGQWTPLKLKCERRLCGNAGEISNGHFVYSGVEFGDTATAVCDEGYVLVGRGTRNCMSQGWDGRVPVCEAVACDEPPAVRHAERRGLQEPPYPFRSVVRYRCRLGTLVGPRELWCTKTGTWSDPPPQCKVITCPSPNVPNAYWRGPHDGKYQFRETTSIVCRQGYERSGPSSITCNSEGSWDPGLPKCIRLYRWSSRG